MGNDSGNSDAETPSGAVQFTEEQARSAQDALTRRPRISIRLRIAAGFLVTFAFTCCLTIAAVVFISNIASRLQLLERAGNIEFEIQQARRFEKNWFLYGTNLYDALNNAQNAEHLLNNSQNEMTRIIGERAYHRMTKNVVRYRVTLERLDALAKSADTSSGNQRLQLESDLRQIGAEIVSQASNIVDQERLRIRTWLRTSMVIAVAALVVILLFVAIIAAFITHQIIRPFGRFERYTQRIAAGDFSLIKPARKYRDEFTNLAIALNQMLLEIKRHEDQLIQSRKLAAIGNLTAGIAHELNNPLNNISITAEALIDEFDDWNRDEKLKMLGTIAEQVERAGATVANLLDFTRRDASLFEEIAINDVITRTTRLVANEMNLSNVTLALELASNLPRVHGNAHNLQQVFLNLFLNAIQAMPDGGTMSVRSYVEDDLLQVDVRDTGVGIPAEDLDKIFDPFFTTKEVGEGTGLGLSVSYGIMKRHQGRLTVTSEAGKGSTFSIALPLSSSATVGEQQASAR
jgi:two-component system NtrC family sensor kinase